MAELILEEDEQVNRFLKHERPMWPQIATPCVVSACGDVRKYSSFRDFMDHWRDVYFKTKTYYKCQNCRRLFATKKHQKAHEKSSYHHSENVTFDQIEKPNESFVDPADKLPYQLGSREFRTNMRQAQRELSSAKRKLDAIEWASARTEQCTDEEISHQLCRDERVVGRNGILYKDTNLWDSPRRRKRTRLQ